MGNHTLGNTGLHELPSYAGQTSCMQVVTVE